MKNKTFTTILLSIIISIILSSCQKKPRLNNNDKPVAKVYDTYLMMSELEKAIPDNLSPDDSAAQAESYINRWVREQLLVNLAENYLKDEKHDIDRKVKAFRNSLLIHTLRNKIISDKLDTAIGQDAIRQYYEAHKQDFILNEPVVQGYLIKIPLEEENLIEQVKQLVSYNLPEDIDKAQNLINQNKAIFLDFRSQWRDFIEITTYLPFNISNPQYFLENKRVIETTDDKYYYYLRITDFMLSGETMPLELAQDKIKKILLNKQGEKIFHDLESTLYTEGIKKGKVKLFY